MGLGFDVTINVSQKLILSQKMKLSLKILQMTNGELTELLKKEERENIFIKIERGALGARGKTYSDTEYDPYSNCEEQATSFYGYLYEQVGVLDIEPEMRRICEYIIDNIDSKGYLSHWVRHPFIQMEFDRGLEIVRSLEPAGVGADNLKECLKLQLAGEEVYERILIEDYLEELAYGSQEMIAEGMGVSQERLKEVVARVRGLNPIPSRGYYVEERGAGIIPDAYIRTEESGIVIEINEEAIPKVLIEQSELVTANPRYEKYLKKCRDMALAIIECMEKRKNTFEKILRTMVEKQREYFLGGRLKPLSLADIACDLEIHPSTVSRGVKDRYISIDGSVIKLKSLFVRKYSPKVERSSSASDLTRVEVKERIQKIIATECRDKPYSDDKLVKIMSKDGIEISRRTISKYREEMNIPPSTKRRIRK